MPITSFPSFSVSFPFLSGVAEFLFQIFFSSNQSTNFRLTGLVAIGIPNSLGIDTDITETFRINLKLNERGDQFILFLNNIHQDG